VLHAALDFINCHLPPKPCVPEPRTFIGEYGYFLRNKNCTALMAPPVKSGAGAHRPTTPEIVMQRSMWHMAQAIAWGSPFTLFWELYSNEPGVDAEGQACDRGYWLVDDKGADAPVFTGFKQYFAAANEHLASYAASHAGAAPDLNSFRVWAVAKLGELAGYTEVPLPEVRPLDLEAAAIAGGH